MKPNSYPVPRVASLALRLHNEPWAITEEAHGALSERALGVLRGTTAAQSPQAETPKELSESDKYKGFEIVEGVARIPITGVMYKGFSEQLYDRIWDVTSTDVVERLVRVSANDSSVRAILLDVDSPGGLTSGVPSLADAVMEARMNKPVIAYTNGMMASAAYYVGSQADAVLAADGSSVGSIGVFIKFADFTQLFREWGISVEVFKSGRYKGMGSIGTSLTDEQRQHLQATVMEIFAEFKAAVLRARPGVKDDAMQGQGLQAKSALAAKLIDGIQAWPSVVRDTERLINIRANNNGRVKR